MIAPDVTLDELLEVMPGPDFPTGGIICGGMGIRQAYLTGRSTLALRSRTHFETEKNSDVIVVTEIPYMETRDRIREKLELLVAEERIKRISPNCRPDRPQCPALAGTSAHCTEAGC
ncbi:hypothetical protein E3A20_00820 [Planctomyces bekefii]|uniref:Topo IIA-type catalytic domain-containing protein n=1 Tax=Planctomyces bekefii TaxID=1653850 RepID=A0A5C6MHR4_9PLAN|nr:hypothetical protein E3A20_00820 [Planctomyces bekefii]